MLQLQSEIKGTLLALNSYTRIRTEFKEAAQYLPVKEKMELTVTINDIRKKL